EGSPFETNLAFDMIAQAMGGPISVTGEKGRQPVKPGLSFGDTGTGMTMAITVLAALRKREKTGEGCRLQVAMQDAMIHYMRTNFSIQAGTGKPPERDSTHSGGGSNAPSGLFPCAPGGANDYVWIMTSRGNPEHWSRLCKVMGKEDLIEDPRFTSPAARAKNQEELEATIASGTKQRTKHEVMAQVGGAGIPAGAVLDTMELSNDPTFEKRGIMQVMPQKTPPAKMPGWPVRINGKPPKVKASPALGEHTAEVLTDWLGMDAAKIAKLKGDGVFRAPPGETEKRRAAGGAERRGEELSGSAPRGDATTSDPRSRSSSAACPSGTGRPASARRSPGRSNRRSWRSSPCLPRARTCRAGRC